MKSSRSATGLVSCALALAFLFAALAVPAAALPPNDDRPLRTEPDDPQRVVGVLRGQVEWWAREPHPVALAGEFTVDVETLGGAAEPAVDWRLVVTTLDREPVTEWRGTTELPDGRGVALVNFDGRDAEGHPLPAGTYVYRYEAEGFEGSGGFLKVWASDEVPPPAVPDGCTIKAFQHPTTTVQLPTDLSLATVSAQSSSMLMPFSTIRQASPIRHKFSAHWSPRRCVRLALC